MNIQRQSFPHGDYVAGKSELHKKDSRKVIWGETIAYVKVLRMIKTSTSRIKGVSGSSKESEAQNQDGGIF